MIHITGTHNSKLSFVSKSHRQTGSVALLYEWLWFVAVQSHYRHFFDGSCCFRCSIRSANLLDDSCVDEYCAIHIISYYNDMISDHNEAMHYERELLNIGGTSFPVGLICCIAINNLLYNTASPDDTGESASGWGSGGPRFQSTQD